MIHWVVQSYTRITKISKKSKRFTYLLFVALLIVMTAAGCTINEGQETIKPTPEEIRNSAGSLPIQNEADETIPEPVVLYAEDYVRQQIESYHTGWKDFAPENAVSAAKITGITQINTGTAAENTSIDLYLLEYRLRIVGNIENVLVGGMNHEDADGENWLTEWGSTGQPYLLLYCDDSGPEILWQPICVTNTDVIHVDYGAPEMLEQYGNPYTAAAMELYQKYIGAEICVDADYAVEELLSQYASFDEFALQPDEYAQRILISTSAVVEDFRFVDISFSEADEQEILFIENEELYSLDELTPDHPLVVWVSFPGTIPSKAITFTDETGQARSFAIVASGKDGSILLSEIRLLYR